MSADRLQKIGLRKLTIRRGQALGLGSGRALIALFSFAAVSSGTQHLCHVADGSARPQSRPTNQEHDNSRRG